MPLTTIELQHTIRALSHEPGYVLDFTDQTFGYFFASEVGVDIDDPKYQQQGTSKVKRLSQFLITEPDTLILKALNALFEYRKRVPYQPGEMEHREFSKLQGLSQVIGRLMRTVRSPTLLGAVEQYAEDETLEELIASITRGLEADSPAATIDHLHTYCMKKFAHLLRGRNVDPTIYSTLDGRAGAYNNAVRRGGAPELTDRILQSTTKIFTVFNEVRNKRSLAHDSQIVSPAEARYLVDTVLAMLRFLKTTEGMKFELRT